MTADTILSYVQKILYTEDELQHEKASYSNSVPLRLVCFNLSRRAFAIYPSEIQLLVVWLFRPLRLEHLRSIRWPGYFCPVHYMTNFRGFRAGLEFDFQDYFLEGLEVFLKLSSGVIDILLGTVEHEHFIDIIIP